jgi:hypothetical protein
MLTKEQARILDRYLTPRADEELDPPHCTLSLTKQQLAFLLDAITQYEATRCPLEGKGAGCELLVRYESPTSGAVHVGCPTACLAWRDQLIEQFVPAAFPHH